MTAIATAFFCPTSTTSLAAVPDLLDELRSEEYDAQSVAEALRAVRKSRDERLPEIKLGLSRGIDAMSAIARSAYADRLEQMLRDSAHRAGRCHAA